MPETPESQVPPVRKYPNPVGRPTEYRDTYPQKTIEYTDECIANGGIPTRAELALTLGHSKDSVLEWEKKHEDFSGALSYLDANQEVDIVKGGMNRKYHHIITKLMLHNHDYKDRSDLTTDNEKIEGVQIYKPVKS